eukprot:TRINITY_DN2655_c0_g1_i2.p1 TRINITY_DN2655_c0_g1~~TRINITY_DN2655_c0_g1_i2.p1  ORF type:complete len:347 (+),score=35.61 TRINITY_DN2655_c0_g1_i2:1065-2105(+)
MHGYVSYDAWSRFIQRAKEKKITNTQQVLELRKVNLGVIDIYGYLEHYNGINQLIKSLCSPLTPPKTRIKIVKMLFDIAQTHEEVLETLEKELIKTNSIHRMLDLVEKQGVDEVYILLMLNRLMNRNDGFKGELRNAILTHRTLISKVMNEVDEKTINTLPTRLLSKADDELIQLYRSELYFQFAIYAFNRPKLAMMGYKIPDMTLFHTSQSFSVRIPYTNISIDIPKLQAGSLLAISFMWSVSRAMRPYVPRMWNRSVKFSQLPLGAIFRCGVRTTTAVAVYTYSTDMFVKVTSLTQSKLHNKNQLIATSVMIGSLDFLLNLFVLSKASFWVFPLFLNLHNMLAD